MAVTVALLLHGVRAVALVCSGARRRHAKNERSETRAFEIQQNCSLLSPCVEKRRITGLASCCAKVVGDVEWLFGQFNMDLSVVAHIGGHSDPRTHGGEMSPKWQHLEQEPIFLRKSLYVVVEREY